MSFVYESNDASMIDSIMNRGEYSYPAARALLEHLQGLAEGSGEPIELLQRCPLSPVFADSPFLQRRLVALTRFCRRGHFLTLSRPWPFFDHGMLQ